MKTRHAFAWRVFCLWAALLRLSGGMAVCRCRSDAALCGKRETGFDEAVRIGLRLREIAYPPRVHPVDRKCIVEHFAERCALDKRRIEKRHAAGLEHRFHGGERACGDERVHARQHHRMGNIEIGLLLQVAKQLENLRAAAPDLRARLFVAEPQPGPLWEYDPSIRDEATRALLEGLGATFLPFESRHFGQDYAYGNKIEALFALPEGEPFVFFDTDTLVTGPLDSVACHDQSPRTSVST